MAGPGRQEAWWALGVCGAAVAAFFAFRTPEPALTGLTLVESICGAASERMQLFERHVADPLAVSLRDVPDLGGELSYSRAELRDEVARLVAAWPSCAFSLDDWRIREQADGGEWLEGVLVYSESQPGDLHGERRSLRALFRTRSGVQQLERLILGARERRLPEARP
jgi:hypothetical protein